MHIHFCHFNRHRCATSTDTDAPLQQTQMRHFNRHKCTFISASTTHTDAVTDIKDINLSSRSLQASTRLNSPKVIVQFTYSVLNTERSWMERLGDCWGFTSTETTRCSLGTGKKGGCDAISKQSDPESKPHCHHWNNRN